MKKVLSTFLLGLLAAAVCLSMAMAEEYSFVCENDEYALYAEEATGSFYVQHLDSGAQWWSNPPKRAEDRIAKGMQKMDLNSVLLLRLFDIPVRNETLANNFTGSVKKDGAVFSKLPNGFRMSYTLPNFKMTIPMEVMLQDDFVEISVLVDQVVEENPNALLASVSITPFFHAAGSDESGYMLVPDGSGALIYLNNKKQALGEYKQNVYGRDLAYNMAFVGNVEQPVNLPVFGMHKETSGYLAVISQGAAHAAINARMSGAKSTYNTAFAEFSLRTSDNYEIGQQNQIRMFDTGEPAGEKISVRYYLLPGENSDYNAMAQRYREHLTKEEGLVSRMSDTSLVLECYGAVRKQQSYLGFPYMKEIALTRFEDAIDILRTAQDAGVSGLALVFQRMTETSLSGVYQSKFKPADVLGGEKAFKVLRDYCEQNSILLAPVIDSLKFSKNSLLVNSYANATKTLPQQVAVQYTYRLGTGRVDYDRTANNLLRPAQLLKKTTGMVKSLDGYDLTSVAPLDLGKLLYSDFVRPRTARFESQQHFVQSMEMLNEAIPSLVFSAPNSYAFPYAALLCDVPQTSSQYDLCDVNVPFYQLSLSGLIPYASSSINLCANPTEAFLQTMENGSILKYSLIEEDASILIDTELDTLLGVSRSDWLDDLIASTLEWQAVRMQTGTRLVRHEIVTQHVRKALYENGQAVYVNYGEDDYPLATGQCVPAVGYLLVEEETP